MKTILGLFAALFVLWACSDDSYNCREEPGGEGTRVALSFVAGDMIVGRGFAQNTATSAEKKVLSAKIFIFKGGNKIFEKLLLSSELPKVGIQPDTFVVPGLLPSTTYDYYVVINNGDVSAANLTALQGITLNDISAYNGAWNTVNDTVTKPKRSGGFVMVGNANTPTTANLSNVQSVPIAVKRVTAKIDIQTVLDNTVFGSGKKYPGTFTLDSVIISKTQPTSSLLYSTPPTSAGSLTLAKQLPNFVTATSTYQNRFYLFENGNLLSGNRTLLTLYATYTNSGVPSYVTYTTELSGGANGSIVRNGAYVVNLTIKGLTGTSVAVNITLSDWESIVTQNADLGS